MAKQATSAIPIVGLFGDIVEDGLVTSYARPEGNVTGPTTAIRPLIGKRLDLLRETVPAMARIAVLRDGRLPDTQRPPYEEPARALGIQTHMLDPRGPDELESAIASAVADGADALYVQAAPPSVAQRTRIVPPAAEYRLPAMYETRAFVPPGGLLAYFGDENEMFRRGASFVDRILRGAKPADLPVEQPMRFELVVNLETARTLRITVPPHVLLQATEIVQ